MAIGMRIKLTTKKPRITYKVVLAKVLDESAEATVNGIVTGIKKNEAVDGSRQKQNSDAWRQNKRSRRVKPNVPVHNEGLFIAKNTYKIIKSLFKRIIRIKGVQATLRGGGRDMPRDKVARKLQREGYDFFGVTKRANSLINLILKRGVEKMFQKLKTTVKVFKSK